MYGLEKKRCYSRNGWVVGESENRERSREYSKTELIKRERDSARVEENRKISEARYNRMYRDFSGEKHIKISYEKKFRKNKSRGKGESASKIKMWKYGRVE